MFLAISLVYSSATQFEYLLNKTNFFRSELRKSFSELLAICKAKILRYPAQYDEHKNLFGEFIVVVWKVIGSSFRSEKYVFVTKGNRPTNVLDSYYVGDAADAHATQIAFLSFITRLISQETDAQKLLTLTLEHTVPYLDVSFGEIWLTSKDGKRLELAAILTPHYEYKEIREIERGRGLLGWVANKERFFSTRSPSNDPRYDRYIDSINGFEEYSLLAVPMRHLDVTIGVLAFYDVFGGSINDHEALLIEAVARFAASAYMNVRTKQALHDIALQTARSAIVGRLTATLSHEINNPMQAIRGALVLSMEELDDPEALEDYINLSLHETDRVVQLVNHIQQIYNPAIEGGKPAQLNDILQDIIPIMDKELSKQDIVLHTDFADDFPESSGFSEQLYFVFVSLILTLADAIKEVGGIDLTIRSSPSSSGVRVEIHTKAKLPEWVDVFGPDNSPIMVGSGFGLSFSQDIIVALGGTITLRRMDSETLVTIELPLQTYNE